MDLEYNFMVPYMHKNLAKQNDTRHKMLSRNFLLVHFKKECEKTLRAQTKEIPESLLQNFIETIMFDEHN